MALSSGVYSLVGVAIGGGITWGTQWGIAARTDRLDARVAKRQVRAELRRHRQTEWWEAVLWPDPAGTGTGPVPDLRPVSGMLANTAVLHEEAGSKAWAKHSDRLARLLSDRDWDVVEQAYDGIADLVTWKDGPPPSPALVERVKQTHARIEDAIRRLQ